MSFITYLLIFVALVIIFIFKDYFLSEKCLGDNCEPTELKKNFFEFAENNILPTDYDWLSTPYGKFLETYLGSYTNLIIWTLVILAIWWLVSTVFELLFSKKENRKIEYGISGWLFLILLIGTGAYIFVSAITNADPKTSETKVEKSSFVSVRLFGIKIGESKIVPMSLTTIANVSIPSSSKADRATTNIACAKIVKPLWLIKMEGFPNKHLYYDNAQPSSVDNFKFTIEMKKFMAENDVTGAEVEFTLIETQYGSSNCPHSISPWSK